MDTVKILNDIPQIETKRLILRKLTMDDIDDIYEYACLPDMTTYLIWHPHKGKQESADFVKFTWGQLQEQISIIWGIELKEEKKIIGTIDLRKWNTVDRCGDTGYGIAPKYWSRGITSEALDSVINFGFGFLLLNRIEAHCEEANKGSWKVMEKCGMKFEGVLREKVFIKDRFRTMKMYSILRNEWSDKN
jgi:[ribosomal protein S5]-alanine N-acetyltransferase